MRRPLKLNSPCPIDWEVPNPEPKNYNRELDLDVHKFFCFCDPSAEYVPSTDMLSYYEQHTEVPGGACEFLMEPFPKYTTSIDDALLLPRSELALMSAITSTVLFFPKNRVEMIKRVATYICKVCVETETFRIGIRKYNNEE
jgi:hypothetical protein